MHFFFNICMFVALSQIGKVKAVKFLHWRFQNTTPYPFRIKTRNVEKILFTLKWSSYEVWIYVNSSVMEVKYMQYKLLSKNCCKENLDFSICYLSKVWNPWLGNALFFIVRNLWSSVIALFFFPLNARVLLTLSVRGKLCCNWERVRESDWKNCSKRVICIRQRNK